MECLTLTVCFNIFARKHSSWWRHLEDVFVFVFRRRLQNVLIKRNIFALLIRLQKKSSRRLAKKSSKVFKAYHQVKLFLLTRLWDIFNTFLWHTAKMVIYRRICLGHISVWEIYGQCTNFARVIKILQVLVFHVTTPFSGILQRRI